jgi:hypothetical protein
MAHYFHRGVIRASPGFPRAPLRRESQKHARQKKGPPINLHQQLLAQSPIRVALVANFDPRAKGASRARLSSAGLTSFTFFPHAKQIAV